MASLFENGKLPKSEANILKGSEEVKRLIENLENGKVNGKCANGSMSDDVKKLLKAERESILLWTKPMTTLHYGFRELSILILEWCSSFLKRKMSLLAVAVIAVLIYTSRHLEGPHQGKILEIEAYLLWCLWWVGLGVLSSVGLGTGLHTFLLYLGPHIASVTLASYECGTTDFPSPPYPDSIVCPEPEANSAASNITKAAAMTIWQIMSKVRVEAFCWGVGTALGELPPYFMARAHRLSGRDDEDDDEDEFMELQETMNKRPEDLSWLDKAKLEVEKLVEKVGFFGILACASIPNPLFDLAGITCGHFLVPFWTFFGATVIGKAVIKMHIQKLFVILAFNETLIATVVSQLHRIPIIGLKLESPLKEALRMQKEKLHRTDHPEGAEDAPPILSWIFEKLVLMMVIYFLVSILNSLAQSYHKRINKKKDARKMN